MSGNIIVDWNSTLTIESGVNALFDSNASLTVCGHLMVHGTPENPVRFDHSTNAVPPWTWDGIELHSDENSMLYAEIIGARNSIQIEGSSNTMESCVIGSSDGFPGSGRVLISNSAGPNYILNSSLTNLKPAIALEYVSRLSQIPDRYCDITSHSHPVAKSSFHDICVGLLSQEIGLRQSVKTLNPDCICLCL